MSFILFYIRILRFYYYHDFVRNFSKSFNAISNIDEQMQFLGTGLARLTRYLHAKGCSPKPRFIKRSRGKKGHRESAFVFVEIPAKADDG